MFDNSDWIENRLICIRSRLHDGGLFWCVYTLVIQPEIDEWVFGTCLYVVLSTEDSAPSQGHSHHFRSDGDRNVIYIYIYINNHITT